MFQRWSGILWRAQVVHKTSSLPPSARSAGWWPSGRNSSNTEHDLQLLRNNGKVRDESFRKELNENLNISHRVWSFFLKMLAFVFLCLYLLPFLKVLYYLSQVIFVNAAVLKEYELSILRLVWIMFYILLSISFK